MKKILSILATIFCFIFAFALVACNGDGGGTANGGNQNVPPVETDDDRPSNTESEILVVYFSQPDNVSNSYVEIDGETFGNTQYMAYVIQENTGANIFRIVPETPYPTDHSALVDLAQTEQRNNARPKFVGAIENFEKYDTVFVGYPNWWSDMPMILYTFFDTYDFAGKTIIPFNTHGGSGFSNTVNTIRNLEPEAEVKNGKSISRNNIQTAEQEIIDWVKSLGFEKPAPAGGNVLVVYFSASGNTANVAKYIAEATRGTLFELVPVNEYSSADLNYGNHDSRVYREYLNEELRDIALTKTTPDDWAAYDTVFVGYPIWWGIAAWPVNHFVKDNDFTGKTVMPFCTSASSGMGQSGTLLATMAGTGDWQEGRRFSSGVSKADVEGWVTTLALS